MKNVLFYKSPKNLKFSQFGRFFVWKFRKSYSKKTSGNFRGYIFNADFIC